ncbi:hypothetical protein [Comamonas serinivorans]|uniref:hypothetical protein n=1 Tax=Comamonas serinivorans TaxID=1082851 RepID=UPI0012FCBA8E|nr:hypothetical protein [Comamonas serinivorans]
MAAIAEAMAPNGTVLGALMTFIGWGVCPLAIVLYILGTPARKRRLRRQADEQAAADTPAGDGPPPEPPSTDAAAPTPSAHRQP